MRNYQRKKNNPYKLPQNLYMRMLYLIRDYDRIRSEREDIIHSSPPMDGVQHSGTGNPTEQKALKLLSLDRECEAVADAIACIPEEYRKAVLSNICYGSPYPIIADSETYGRWRRKLVYFTAKNLGLT